MRNPQQAGGTPAPQQAAINAESAREKSIRHGHPSTLHLWWARRPLAACRAVLFASLVDDPDSDPQYRKADGSVNEDYAGTKRADLFNLIEELVMWENSNNPDVIRTARAEIARCVASRLIETGMLKKDKSVGGNTTAGDLVTRRRLRRCHPRQSGGLRLARPFSHEKAVEASRSTEAPQGIRHCRKQEARQRT
jgi:hypothetical protein